MLRFLKAFLNLALWRITPAQLPASWLLLAIVCVAVALLEVLGTLLPPAQTDRILIRVVLSVTLPLVFTWAVLAVARHRQRFLQTAVALLGVGVLAQLALSPLDSVLEVIGADHPAAIPLALLSIVGLVWYLLACAHIWRAALESGLIVGIAISVGYLILSVALAKFFLRIT
jgi:hypothetical protein